MSGTFYILLPVHNRREITRRFISCLKVQTYTDYHLVLIDDGSVDGTREMVESEISKLSVLTGCGDWWWAGALQQGYEWLKQQVVSADDLVLIINDDTEPPADFLEKANQLYREQPGSLLLAQAFSRETGALVSGGVHVNWRKLQFSHAVTSEQINCLSTRGLILSARCFLGLGGFYPKLLPHYLSDYEFTLRAHRRGLNLWVHDDLKLWVDEGTTGFHEFESESLGSFWRKYFAKKSDANPLAWTVFIGLACPWPWKLVGWLRVWYGTTVKVFRVLSS